VIARLFRSAALATALILANTAYAQNALCHGRFANPLTDICWRCLFPLSLGAVPLMPGTPADTPNPPVPVCACPNPPKIGLTIGFWEPVRMVDVTRVPFCLVGLGFGLDLPLPAPRGAQVMHDSQTRTSFYQVHWYVNPILDWLEVLLDFPCLEKGALDIAYLTEFDPLWNDDELAAILEPEAVLFANPIAKAACAADCVAATAHLPIPGLFWCAGCQGSTYPMTGHATTHIGGIQAAMLLTQRMTAKMHRQLLTFETGGPLALCSPYPQPIPDRSHYRTQLVYPIPDTGIGTGACCHPFGRSTILWGAGKSYPVSGEDFAIQLFRKRNCCASAY